MQIVQQLEADQSAAQAREQGQQAVIAGLQEQVGSCTQRTAPLSVYCQEGSWPDNAPCSKCWSGNTTMLNCICTVHIRKATYG